MSRPTNATQGAKTDRLRKLEALLAQLDNPHDGWLSVPPELMGRDDLIKFLAGTKRQQKEILQRLISQEATK